MSQTSKDSPSLGAWLQSSSSVSRELLSQVDQIRQLNELLSQWSGPTLGSQLRVANIRHGTVVIYTPSAAALITLRTRGSELLAFLTQHSKIACTALDAKVSTTSPIYPTKSTG